MLYKHGGKKKGEVAKIYDVHDSTVLKALSYAAPEGHRPGRMDQPRTLNKEDVDAIIDYCTANWHGRALDWPKVHAKLESECSLRMLEMPLKCRGLAVYEQCARCWRSGDPLVVAAGGALC